jgi:anti-anti-sigma factor
VANFEMATRIVNDGSVIVTARGYLSGSAGERLEEEIGRLLSKGNRDFVINFKAADIVNSVGISILVGVIEKVRDYRGRLFFSELSAVNDEVFRLMGLDRFVPFKLDDGEAIASLGGDGGDEASTEAKT